jgi:hypothetical protein
MASKGIAIRRTEDMLDQRMSKSGSGACPRSCGGGGKSPFLTATFSRTHKLVVVLQATALLAIVLTATFSSVAHAQISEKQESGSTVYGRAIYHDS